MKSITYAPLFLLSILSTLHQSFPQLFGANTRDVTGLTSLYELCPYTDYCTSNATDKLEDTTKTQCCGNCSCADDCWERGNCCKDKLPIVAQEPLESCEKVEINGHKIRQNWGYYVTKRCPNKESSLGKKCSGELEVSLEDSVWVTDRRPNKIYGNKYCAQCYGVMDYTPWQMATHCTLPVNGTNSPGDVVKSFVERCSLTVVPPNTEDHTNNACLIPDITACNETGLWKVHDQTVYTACNSFQQTYINERLFLTSIFRNIYCFLCNSPNQLISDVCKPIILSDRDTAKGFIGLIDFKTIKRKNEVDSVSECAPDEVKDPFQDRCLKLSCPLLKSPVYGQCVKLWSSTKYLAMYAVLVFTPVGVKPNAGFDESSFHFEDVATNLSHIVWQTLAPCKRCEETFYASFGNRMTAESGKRFAEWFSNFISFHTTESCQEDLIVEKLNRLLGSEIQLPIGNEYITLMISTVNSEKDRYYQDAQHRYIIITNSYCQNVMDFRDISVCPSVQLNFTDYNALMRSTQKMSKRRLINSLFRQTAKEGDGTFNTENDDTTNMGKDASNMAEDAANTENNVAINIDSFKVQVCLESYLSVLPKKNQGRTSSSAKVVLFVAIILSSR